MADGIITVAHSTRRLRNRRKYVPYTLAFVGSMCLLLITISHMRTRLAGPDDNDAITAGSRTLQGKSESLTTDSGAVHVLASSIGSEQTCSSSFDQDGGIALYLVGILYMFLGLAIICDEHFIASLEVISDKLNLSEDVAGATFMAAGSSAPELFTSLMGTFFSTAAVGVGTIIGSAIFNLLVIIGLTAALSGAVLYLDWRPLTRDSIFYAIAIGTMIAVFADSEVQWWESLILLFGYVVYVAFMTKNEKILQKCGRPKVDSIGHGHIDGKKGGGDDDVEAGGVGVKAMQSFPSSSSLGSGSGSSSQSDSASGSASDSSSNGDDSESGSESYGDSRTASYSASGSNTSRGYGRDRRDSNSDDDDEDDEGRRISFVHPRERYSLDIASGHVHLHDRHKDQHKKKEGAGDDDDDDSSKGSKSGSKSDDEPSGFLGKLVHYLSLPWVWAFMFTIPDCREKRFKGGYWFILTFTMSIAWIVGISYWMVEWATKISCILDMDAEIMGITLLAGGTSVPDAMSSVLVGKEGKGDMAIANSIGSNVFDIFLGLGFPWFIATCLYRPGEAILVDTARLAVFAIILFGLLILTLLLLIVDKWRLRPVTGFVLFGLYAVFVTYAFLSGTDTIDF